jgi:hypothetical protein
MTIITTEKVEKSNEIITSNFVVKREGDSTSGRPGSQNRAQTPSCFADAVTSPDSPGPTRSARVSESISNK